MTQNCPARQCRCCCFCRQIGEALCCVRSSPTPDPATGQARWPTVQPTDFCGAFACEATRTRHSSLFAREAQGPDDASSIGDATGGQPEIDNQSCRDAATALNHQSSIIHNQSPALPVFTDEYGPYCKIPLTQNRFAKVDPEDYLWLSQFRWCCKVGKDTCYAIRHIQVHGRTKRIHMHRQIMNTPKGMICDHINHDGLDNRRKNCRNCTIEQNNANRRKRATSHGSPAPTSQFIGVSWCSRRQKWVSYIKHHGRSRFLGQYDRPEDAARAHDRAAWETWGEYANLNFPDEYPAHPAAKRRASHHRGTEDTEKTYYPQINADARRLGKT